MIFYQEFFNNLFFCLISCLCDLLNFGFHILACLLFHLPRSFVVVSTLELYYFRHDFHVNTFPIIISIFYQAKKSPCYGACCNATKGRTNPCVSAMGGECCFVTSFDRHTTQAARMREFNPCLEHRHWSRVRLLVSVYQSFQGATTTTAARIYPVRRLAPSLESRRVQLHALPALLSAHIGQSAHHQCPARPLSHPCQP